MISIHTMTNWFRKQWFVFLFAFLVGVIFIFPHWYLRIADRVSFHDVDMLGSDAELHYVARIQEIYDGHANLGQTYLWEGKDLPYLQPPLPEIAVAFLGKIFDLGAIGANVFAKFLFGFLLAVLIYFFLFEVFGDVSLSLAAAGFILLGSVFTSWPDVVSLFSRDVRNFEFLRYARPINPAISSLCVFGYLFSLLRLQKSLQNRYRVFCVLTLGLSFYTYVYAWSYLFIVNALFFVWFLARREWHRAFDIVLISIGALVVALPYGLNTVAATHNQWYRETFERFGFFASRAPVVSKFALLGAACFFVSYLRKLPSAHAFLGLSFAASIVAVNHQLISGVNIQNDHYHWYVVTPLASIIILSSLYFFIRDVRWVRLARVGMIFAIAVFFAGAVLVQVKSYAFLRGEVMSDQRFAPLFRWLDMETPRDSVVVADAKLSELIPAYTHNNVYYSVYAPYYLVSDERLKQNYFVYLYLTGVRGDTVAEFLRSHHSETAAYLFGLRYRYTAGCSGCFSDSEDANLAVEYRKFLSGGVMMSLKRYRADYVVWDGVSDGTMPFPQSSLQKEFEANGIAVYKIL